MQKVCKIKFPMQWAEGNLIKFQSKLLKNNKDIFEEKVEADMVLAFSTMKVSVVISFQMDKQIDPSSASSNFSDGQGTAEFCGVELNLQYSSGGLEEPVLQGWVAMKHFFFFFARVFARSVTVT